MRRCPHRPISSRSNPLLLADAALTGQAQRLSATPGQPGQVSLSKKSGLCRTPYHRTHGDITRVDLTFKDDIKKPLTESCQAQLRTTTKLASPSPCPILHGSFLTSSLHVECHSRFTLGLFKKFLSALWVSIELIWRDSFCLPNFAAKFPRNSFPRKCSKVSHITHLNKKNTSSSRNYFIINKWMRLTFQESFLIGWIVKVLRKICLFTTWVNFLSENGGECREMRTCGRGRWILGVLCLLWQETP